MPLFKAATPVRNLVADFGILYSMDENMKAVKKVDVTITGTGAL